MEGLILTFVLFFVKENRAFRLGDDLQPYMPNVCVERELALVAQRQPCVQAFTRMVKVWKQGCVGQTWCTGYERRTVYYTAYRQVYRQDYQTVYKCCPGWSQLNGEAGCLYPVCRYGVCFNGGRCRGGAAHLCDCPPGFNGPSCQYGEYRHHQHVLCSKALCFLLHNAYRGHYHTGDDCDTSVKAP
ncbi:multiple epidermal growth factor-like domains protein 6 [Thalassophryne amazonica]|uniref:multiple epidermal growth factor-like domains protein 6 n=1 Tax=Thalassophryne amazonica TaxID=390379 RepID=UPI001471F870|nr:multiple epidermal growth factor-like domains protein 6 [Thalassophryne amazonica]